MNDLVALSPKEAVEIGAKSLTKYGKLFFPRTFRQDSAPFHEEIGGALYSPARFNGFEVFRGGAKTTLLRVYTSQRIAYGVSRVIMYVSISQAHSIFSVRWVRRQVMYNTRWANTFGLRRGSKWTDEWAELECHLLEDPEYPGQPVRVTLLAMGITGQIRGFNPEDFRPDLIVIDDVLNEENTATRDQRKKIEELLFGALLNSLAPASESPLAKAVFLQTPMDKQDAIEKCMTDPEWNPIRFGCFNELGESRWPSRYPTEVLKRSKEAHIRRSQYRLWMREWECQIVSGEEKAIDITRFKYYDLLPEHLDTVISLDPASSENPNADEFAIAAVGIKGLDVYVIDYSCAQAMMPDKAANDTFTLALLCSPRKFVVESNSYQRIMAWYLEQEMIKRRMFYAVERLEVKTKNSDRIMQTIPGAAAFGHFHIRPTHTKLIQQADEYDPSVSDIPDDLLTAIANAIISLNPAMRSLLTDDELGFIAMDDEREYKPLVLRGAP